MKYNSIWYYNNILSSTTQKLKISALRIYLCSVELVDYNEFVKGFLPFDAIHTIV